MTDTKAEIIRIGDSLIRSMGYNAISFTNISNQLNIRNASIHHHFPTKSSLAIAIIDEHINRLELLKSKVADKDPLDKLKGFLSIYSTAKSDGRICIVGSLATDLYSLDPEIQSRLKDLVDAILKWVMEFLSEGKEKSVFHFENDIRTKALWVITTMMAAVQLTRLTTQKDFDRIKQNVITELTQQ